MFFSRTANPEKSKTQLENENRNLSLNMMTISDQLENYKAIVSKYQNEYKELSSKVETFCKMILDHDYAQQQIGGNNPFTDMNVFQLMEYTIESFKTYNMKNRDLMIEITEKLKEKDQQIEGLKAQISQLQTKMQHQANAVAASEDVTEEDLEETSEPKEQKQPADETHNTAVKTESSPKTEKAAPKKNVAQVAIIEDDDDDDDLEATKKPEKTPKNNTEEKKEAPSGANSPSDKKQTDSSLKRMKEKEVAYEKSEREFMAHVVDLNDYMDKMTDIMWLIMKGIGEKGFSESKDIKSYAKENNITEAALNTAMAQVRKMGIIEQEKINTGYRWFFVYSFSDLGNRIYLEKYKTNPVECEKRALQREHNTALHGYCIKDTAQILRAEFRYQETTATRKENSMKLYNDTTYIPDIVAKKKNGAIVDYFEVELGHHTQKEFNNKCDKMRMVSKDLYFVVPDTDIMNKILTKQIGQWVLEKGGKSKLKGTTIYLTTTKKLHDGKWENIYPF